MQVLRFGVIGCGSRGSYVVDNFLKYSGYPFIVTAAYDPDPSSLDSAIKQWDMPTCRKVATPEELIEAPDVDLVLIFTPNAYHCRYIVSSLEAGKPVFSEKPLATTLADCKKIIQTRQKSGLNLYTGFVLRYSPWYRKVKEMLDSGEFGSIISIAASENRPSFWGGNSMSSSDGWRRLRDESGPYLLEKCSHDLDLLNWYAGGVPVKVAGFGGLDYFVPKHQHLWDKYDHDVFARFVPEDKRINPFTSPKDIYDNNMMIMEYPNGIKASFQLTLANAIPERRTYFSCTEGTIIIEIGIGQIAYKRYGDDCITRLDFPSNGHAAGDIPMAKELAQAMYENKPACTGEQSGLDSSLVALAVDKSMQLGGQVVCLDGLCD